MIINDKHEIEMKPRNFELNGITEGIWDFTQRRIVMSVRNKGC